MAYLKNVIEIQETDNETGEIYQRVTQKTYKVRTTVDEFYMIFLKAVDFESKLNKTDIGLLLQLSKYSAINTNMVFLNKVLKEQIADAMDVKLGSIVNAIVSLKKKGVIVQEGSGTYRINPHFAWKGSLKAREQMINELKIEFIIEPLQA